MDLKDTWSRIVMRHLTVIITTLLLGLGSVALLVVRTHTSYVATARIQAAAKQPTSDVEAAALESQVQGIAGSPAVTGPALDDAHIKADSADIAKKHVKVTRLGSSSLVDIAVTMASPRTAVPLANAIAARTVSFLNDAGQQQAQAAINDIDSSAAALSKTRDGLLSQLSQTNDASKTSALVTQLAGIEQQLAGLMNTRGQLVATVHTASAQLVDEALTAHRASRHLVTYLALGIIASLAVGLLIAAVRETIQPTVPSGRIVAEMLGAPLVTDMMEPTGSRSTALRAAVLQSAQRRGVRTIQVLGPAPATELGDVARAVGAAVRGSLARLTVSVLGTDKRIGAADGPGALLVVPRGVRVADLRPHEDLLAALEWPLLGVIELPRSRRARRAADRQVVVDVTTPAPPPRTELPDEDVADEPSDASEPTGVTLRPANGSAPSFLPSALGNPAPDAFGPEPLPRVSSPASTGGA